MIHNQTRWTGRSAAELTCTTSNGNVVRSNTTEAHLKADEARITPDAINEAAAIAHKNAYEIAIMNGASKQEAMQIADRAAAAKRRELSRA